MTAPAGSERSFRLGLGGIAAGALLLRIVYVLTLARRNPTGGDPYYYHVQANLLADGRGYSEPFTWVTHHKLIPTAIHPPLVSTVLGFASLLGGRSFFTHKMVACVAGTATVIVIGLIVRRLAGVRAGLIAAGLAAVYPNLWVLDGILMPETFFALAIAVVILLAYRWHNAPGVGTSIALGVAIGLAALTRGEALLLLGLLVVPLLVVARGLGGGRLLVLFATILAAFAVTVAPWQIRNAVRFSKPVAISTNGDELLTYANCDKTYHGAFLGFWRFDCQKAKPAGDESERAKFWRDQGFDYARDHAGRLPVVLAARVGRVWDFFRPWQNVSFATLDGRDGRVQRAALYVYWATIPFAIAGAFALRRRGATIIPLVAQIALVTVTAMYAYGATRFRIPGEVALIMLAAVGVNAGVAWLSRGRERTLDQADRAGDSSEQPPRPRRPAAANEGSRA